MRCFLQPNRWTYLPTYTSQLYLYLCEETLVVFNDSIASISWYSSNKQTKLII